MSPFSQIFILNVILTQNFRICQTSVYLSLPELKMLSNLHFQPKNHPHTRSFMFHKTMFFIVLLQPVAPVQLRLSSEYFKDLRLTLRMVLSDILVIYHLSVRKRTN